MTNYRRPPWRSGELLIKLEHVRMQHRRHSTNCTRRSHLTYAAYKRVFHHRGSIRRMNPDSTEGTLNFWPLSPCRKGSTGYPMPDSLTFSTALREVPASPPFSVVLEVHPL